MALLHSVSLGGEPGDGVCLRCGCHGDHLVRQGALQHAAPGDLTHVARAQFEDLCGDGVLLHQGLLQGHPGARGQRSDQTHTHTHTPFPCRASTHSSGSERFDWNVTPFLALKSQAAIPPPPVHCLYSFPLIVLKVTYYATRWDSD